MKYFFNSIFSKAYWRYIFSINGIKSILAIYGFIWLIIESLDFFKVYTRDEYANYAFFIFILIATFISILLKRPIKSILIPLKGHDFNLEVRIADLFDVSGAAVISSNTVFEADVASGKISVNSLQGQFTAKYFTGNQNALIKDLNEEIEQQGKDKTVIIISTVLPGTISRLIKPILGSHLKLCYNPYFIAMGTTIDDFLNAEINLFGVDDENAAKMAEEFYKTVNKAPFFKTTIENAELIKVAYNTFISTKISMMNTIMETCHHLPNTNVDDITEALSLCTTRLISKKYLYGGMGDGGGCHPRDNIALSYLACKFKLSYNWYDNIMKQRESQTEWLADLIIENKGDRQINILGKTFKPETNIITGSPSILLKNILEEKGETVRMWDPWVDNSDIMKMKDEYEWDKVPQLFFIGCKHEVWKEFYFMPDSVVIDPFRYLEVHDNVKYIPIGKNT